MSKRSDMSLLWTLWDFARAHLRYFVLALVAAPVSTVLVVAQPMILQRAIDEYIIVGDQEGIVQMAAIYLVIVLGAFVSEAAYTLFISFGAMRTIADVRLRIYRHTLSLSQSYFDKQPTGKLLTRATSDVEALGETLTAGAVTIVLDVLVVCGVVVGMFLMDAELSLVLLLVVPPLALAVNLLRKILRRLYLQVRTSLATLNAYTAERLTGVEVVQLYGDETRTLTAFNKHLFDYRDTTIRTNVWDALLFAVVDGLSSVTMAMMLWYGAQGIFEEALTAGVLAAFIDYVAKLFRPIQQFSQKVAVIQRAMSALEKITDLLDVAPPKRERDLPLSLEQPSELVLDKVSFAYGPDAPRVLDEVSLQLRPGQVVALVGRTGSGKSTVGKIISSAYEGYEGSIRLAGIELKEVALPDARRFVGTVRQDVHLFPGTVRFNLCLGREVDDATLEQALATASAVDVVERLGGLDGELRAGGDNISQGEAQLLAFARLLVDDAPLVVLDEATASVDSLTEAAIQLATEKILKQKTVLVIAHRLSTISQADLIVVLDKGRVVEQGTHEELLRLDQHYAGLCRQQFQSPGDELRSSE
jgi:ATP-binding cassette, subfamily B, multidrug efflux pump